ncbi:hypothetical protein GXM_02239 [Nostoc sphaeroides CCNUC1]|uniref:Uncharacterized protein n=1 Tax=Nostoc sphaeroides CCNUC1 TaxID=2653204 RepID=A0A5P8VWL1_9NOSO|nr:hypothetical protein GXM_02239 [Nostoc sphaeroides CCNUC1]
MTINATPTVRGLGTFSGNPITGLAVLAATGLAVLAATGLAVLAATGLAILAATGLTVGVAVVGTFSCAWALTPHSIKLRQRPKKTLM